MRARMCTVHGYVGVHVCAHACECMPGEVRGQAWRSFHWDLRFMEPRVFLSLPLPGLRSQPQVTRSGLHVRSEDPHSGPPLAQEVLCQQIPPPVPGRSIYYSKKTRLDFMQILTSSIRSSDSASDFPGKRILMSLRTNKV